MLLDEIKKIKGTPKQLKEFAYVVGGIFLFIGGFLWWKDKTLFPFFLGLGGFLLTLRVIHYAWLRPLYHFWMGLSLCLGFVVSRIILSLLFFLVMLPISLIARLTGQKFLNTSFRTDETTYWSHVEKRERNKDYYEKQY